MTPKVIGLLGSPLPEGNTARLLARAVQGTKDAGCTVELVPVTSLDFQGCQEMFFCRDHETCILDDDMQQIYPKFVDMDGLILATPVMTMGIPGTLKAFMDRFQVFFMAKYLRNQSLISPDRKEKRAGLFICISGMDIPEVFVGAKLTTRAFFDIIDCQYRDELLINGMDTIRDIATRPELLDAAYKKGFALGKSLAQP
ncbi:MAG: flavodoxin family protein [Methanoregula sp.]|uniref:flavodoxin family protein n=2 Tax=Methanoregula sp. TaxID=2052170 RepID=UPI003BAE44AE